MKVFIFGMLEKIEVGGAGFNTHGVRVIASPEMAAKVLATQPEGYENLVRNDDQSEEQITETLLNGKDAMTKWRYADQKDERTHVVLEVIPKEVEQ
jgi:hypothetical protein